MYRSVYDDSRTLIGEQTLVALVVAISLFLSRHFMRSMNNATAATRMSCLVRCAWARDSN